MDCYGTCLDCERHSVPLHEHSFAKLGDSYLFYLWLDDLLNGGTRCKEFPRLFALTRDYEAMVRECWDDM